MQAFLFQQSKNSKYYPRYYYLFVLLDIVNHYLHYHWNSDSLLEQRFLLPQVGQAGRYRSPGASGSCGLACHTGVDGGSSRTSPVACTTLRLPGSAARFPALARYSRENVARGGIMCGVVKAGKVF